MEASWLPALRFLLWSFLRRGGKAALTFQSIIITAAMRLLCLFKVPCPGGGLGTPNPAPWAPPFTCQGAEGAPNPVWGCRSPASGTLQGPVSPPRSCWVVRRWSMLVLILFPGVTWKGMEAQQEGGGAGRVWGQEQGEGIRMQPGNAGQQQQRRLSAFLPAAPSPPQAAPPAPLGAGEGRGAGGETGTSSPHPTSPFSCTLASPRRCTWAGGGGVCSAALRLSSAWGRERELFVPVIACRLPAALQGSPTRAAPGLPAPTAAATSPSAAGCHQRRARGAATARRGHRALWHVAGAPLPVWHPWHVRRSRAVGGTGPPSPTTAMVGAGSQS